MIHKAITSVKRSLRPYACKLGNCSFLHGHSDVDVYAADKDLLQVLEMSGETTGRATCKVRRIIDAFMLCIFLLAL